MTITSSYSFSHKGKREINQDYLISDPDIGIFIVADGVGGIFDAYSEKSLLIEIQQSFRNEKLLIANLESKTKDLSSDNVSVILVKCQGMKSGG